jgi:hypothetical protein
MKSSPSPVKPVWCVCDAGSRCIGYHQRPVDVLRVDDPNYTEPLLVGTTACELTTEELWPAYPHRRPAV